MINIKTQSIHLFGNTYPIKEYQVWWAVEGLGLFDNLEEALSFGRPVQSMPIAYASNGIYEVLPPESDNVASSGDNGSPS